MPDCMPATIEIGGAIAERKLDELESLLPGGCGTNVLREAIDGGAPLHDEDGDAPWGKLEDLEQFCRDNRLTFRRTSNAKFEYDGEVVYWRPRMAEPISNAASQDGHPYATLPGLQEALTQGRSLRSVVKELARFAQPIPPLTVRRRKAR